MNTSNLHQAHHNMVEQQVRPWDVLDDRVLQTLTRISRADYVPTAYQSLAYADTAIPLAHNEVMTHPIVEGSGYLTACLAHLASHVESIDIHPEFTQAAAVKLKAHNIYNVTLHTADAMIGPAAEKNWDVIVFTGSVNEIPIAYKSALRINGRMFVIAGDAPVMQARLITRTGDQAWADHVLFETSLQSLRHAEKKKQFVF